MAAKSQVEKKLLSLSPDARLKVGAKSGYFYCGTVGDFLEHMDEYSMEAFRRAEKKLRASKSNLKDILETSISPSDYAARNVRNEFRVSTKGYEDYLNDYFKECDKRISQRDAAEQALREFTNLRFREVIRFEKSAVEGNCYILVLSGTELGTYWELSDASRPGLSFTTEDSDNE